MNERQDIKRYCFNCDKKTIVMEDGQCQSCYNRNKFDKNGNKN